MKSSCSSKKTRRPWTKLSHARSRSAHLTAPWRVAMPPVAQGGPERGKHGRGAARCEIQQFCTSRPRISFYPGDSCASFPLPRPRQHRGSRMHTKHLSARRERSGEHSRATAQIEHASLAARQFKAIAAIVRPAILDVIELHKLRAFKKPIPQRRTSSSVLDTVAGAMTLGVAELKTSAPCRVPGPWRHDPADPRAGRQRPNSEDWTTAHVSSV
jgi:hypothetical protein